VKTKRVTPFIPLLLALALPLAAATPARNPGGPPYANPPQQSQSQDQTQNRDQPEVKTFAGKITKSNGKYVLEDPTVSSSYYLDDAKSAKKYEGKNVVVTGTLDAANHTIHVQKIESAA
jgi:hypothetical protein